MGYFCHTSNGWNETILHFCQRYLHETPRSLWTWSKWAPWPPCSHGSSRWVRLQASSSSPCPVMAPYSLGAGSGLAPALGGLGTDRSGGWSRDPQPQTVRLGPTGSHEGPTRPRGAGGQLHPGPVRIHQAQAWGSHVGRACPQPAGPCPPHQALPIARGHRGTLPPPRAGLIRLSPFSSSPQGSVAAWPPWGWNGGCACQGHGEGRDLPVRVSAVKKTWILTSGTWKRCWARQQPLGELGLWGGAERSRGNCI